MKVRLASNDDGPRIGDPNEDVGRHIQQGDFAAKAGEGLGHFAADGAPANDGE